MVLVVKNMPANAGDIRDAALIPELGRSPGRGLSKPFQYSCLQNAMGRGAWWAEVHGVAASQTRLSMHACIYMFVHVCMYLQMCVCVDVDVCASQVALMVKNLPANAGDIRDAGQIPGLGRSPGEGKGYPLQFSSLENSMNCIMHGVAKSWARLIDFHFTSHFTYPFHLCL